MKKVLVVGNCNFDGPRICKFIDSNFSAKSCEAKSIKISKDMIKKDKYDLILVNRVCVGDGNMGLELVDYIKNENMDIPTMIITNYKDKMDEAITHGAVKGFGKEDLDSNEDKVRDVIGKVLK
ncbi:hypothetical protein GOV12_07430 [Candidatus Pacearchaeota archaeon]|nr:hypothetical protein [Candidatus Pacearchaeota archaeon]